MSDTYFELATTLHNASVKSSQNTGLIAGVVLITAAGMESYVNELQYMLRISNPYSFPKNIKQLKRTAKHPRNFNEKTYEDIRALYGLRSLLAHYKISDEMPKEIKTSLQRIQRSFPDILDNEKHLSLERILNSTFSDWTISLWRTMVKELYAAGYEPPRPFWIRQLGLRRI
jgi:hypothetical protein